MSAIHNRFGPGAVKLRFTRSGAGRAWRSRTVVVPLAPAHADQACRPHQPRHPLAPHFDAFSLEFGVDARCAVGPARSLMNRTHP